MKIAILGPTYPYRGGISHYTTLLAEELRKEHNTLFLSYSRQYPRGLFPGKTDIDPSEKALTAEAVDYCLDSINPLTWIKTARKITKFKPDMFVLPWWIAFWAPQIVTIISLVKKEVNSEVVFICHNAIEHESRSWKVRVSRFVLKRADRILTHSKQETERLNSILGASSNVVTAFLPRCILPFGDIPEAAAAKSQLGLKGKTLLFFGFVRRYKGLDTLIKAMPEVLKHEDVTLLVVGEFWKNKRRYIQLIDNLGISESVRIVDSYIPNEDIGTYFAAADIVVQPYRSASGSGVCQLAYGFGKPVIATEVGSLVDIIVEKLNGRIVPPENPIALSEAIVSSIDTQSLQRMTNAALENADRLSWDRLIGILVNASRP